MSSAFRPITDVARFERYGSEVPEADMEPFHPRGLNLQP
jgi:hypothetical protein